MDTQSSKHQVECHWEKILFGLQFIVCEICGVNRAFCRWLSRCWSELVLDNRDQESFFVLMKPQTVFPPQRVKQNAHLFCSFTHVGVNTFCVSTKSCGKKPNKIRARKLLNIIIPVMLVAREFRANVKASINHFLFFVSGSSDFFCCSQEDLL